MDKAIEKRRPGSLLEGTSRKKRLEYKAGKVGIILDLYVKGIFEFHIYLVDTDVHGDGVGAGGGIIDDYKRQIYPAARVKVEGDDVICDLSAVCFLNSTLYIFEGFNPPPSTTCYSDNNPYKKRPKSAYRYCVNLSLDLDLGAATSITGMHHAKGIPVALPTPDGEKIIVFSTKFRFKESLYAFELLNLNTQDWVQLPGLPCPCLKPDCKLSSYCDSGCWNDALYTAESYSFIGESQFFLQMPFGAFALDLNKLAWNTLDIPENFYLKGYFEMVMGRYALAPVRYKAPAPVPENYDDFIYEAYIRVVDFGSGGLVSPKDDRKYGGSQLSFLGPPYPEEWLRGVFAISILRPREKENGQACNTCVVQVESEKLLLETVESEEMLSETVESEEMLSETETVESEEQLSETVERSRSRILIDVCSTDLVTLQTNITKRISVHTCFSGEEEGPYSATFFTV